MNKLALARQILYDQSPHSPVLTQKREQALSWGIPDREHHIPCKTMDRPALHEFFGQIGHGGNSLYVIRLAAQITKESKSRNIFFIPSPHQQETGLLNAIALPAALQASAIFIHPAHSRDILWAFEECLRSGQAACVIAEVPFLDLKASRRLQLACERGQSYAFALCHDTRGMEKSSVARTRWQISGKSQNLWSLNLFGGKGVRPHQWIMER